MRKILILAKTLAGYGIFAEKFCFAEMQFWQDFVQRAHFRDIGKKNLVLSLVMFSMSAQKCTGYFWVSDNIRGKEYFHVQDKKLFHLEEVQRRNVIGGRGQFSVDEVTVIQHFR